MTRPSPPGNFDGLAEIEQSRTKGLYHRRLAHYHYSKNTEGCNEFHYAASTGPMGVLLHHLLYHGSNAEGSANRSNGELGDAYGGRRVVSSRVRR